MSTLKKLKKMYRKPKKFFKATADMPLMKMPFFYFIFALYLFSGIVEKIDKLYLGNLLYGPIKTFIIFFIIFVVFFFIFSSFYNLRIIISGGKSNFLLSKKIFLYSKLYVFIYECIIGMMLICAYYSSMKAVENVFTQNYSAILWILIFGYILLYYHSIFMSYKTVKALTKVKKKRAVIFFLILPIIFVTLFGFIVFLPL